MSKNVVIKYLGNGNELGDLYKIMKDCFELRKVYISKLNTKNVADVGCMF